jgi:hypothetical protein
MTRQNAETYSAEETGKRYRAIIRGALHTPPLPAKEFPKKRAPKRKRANKAR